MSILLPESFSAADREIIAAHTCLSGLEVLEVAQRAGIDVRARQTTPPFSSPELSEYTSVMEQLIHACDDGASDELSCMLSQEVQQVILLRIARLFPDLVSSTQEGLSVAINQPSLPIVSGPATTGKSANSEVIATLFGHTLIDGDALHPQQNIDIMSNGGSLDDAHRVAWIERIAKIALELQKSGRSVTITCSALSTTVRTMLREKLGDNLFYFHHYCSLETMRKRAKGRQHPFIPQENNDAFLTAQCSADCTLRIGNESSLARNTLLLDTDYYSRQAVLQMIVDEMSGWEKDT